MATSANSSGSSFASLVKAWHRRAAPASKKSERSRMLVSSVVTQRLVGRWSDACHKKVSHVCHAHCRSWRSTDAACATGAPHRLNIAMTGRRFQAISAALAFSLTAPMSATSNSSRLIPHQAPGFHRAWFSPISATPPQWQPCSPLSRLRGPLVAVMALSWGRGVCLLLLLPCGALAPAPSVRGCGHGGACWALCGRASCNDNMRRFA